MNCLVSSSNNMLCSLSTLMVQKQHKPSSKLQMRLTSLAPSHFAAAKPNFTEDLNIINAWPGAVVQPDNASCDITKGDSVFKSEKNQSWASGCL